MGETSISEPSPWRLDKMDISPELAEVQKLMPMQPHDKQALKESIQADGAIKEPIKGYRGEDKTFMIIAGFNRWQIGIELGYEMALRVVYKGFTGSQLKEIAIRDNLARRQLSQADRGALIEHYLKHWGHLSDRAIAKVTGTTNKTVAKRRHNDGPQGEESPHSVPISVFSGLIGKFKDKYKGADEQTKKTAKALVKRMVKDL